MARRAATPALVLLGLVFAVEIAHSASISLNARTSGQHIFFSGVILAKCYFSGTVTMGDPNHRASSVSFYLSGTADGGSLTAYAGGTDWDYGDYSSSRRAVGSGPYQTEDVAIGEVISTGQSLGEVAWGYADWSPTYP
jgi:hypothetical protein